MNTLSPISQFKEMAVMAFAFLALSACSPQPVDINKEPISFDTSKGTMYFFHKDWLSHETQLPIKFKRRWVYQTPDGYWHIILAPFVHFWSESSYIILEPNGKIIIQDKNNSGQFEIRRMNGQWYDDCCDNGDKWELLDDYFFEMYSDW